METREIRLRLNENGRVVIPASVRKALGVGLGDEIILREEDDGFRIVTQQMRVAEARPVRASALPACRASSVYWPS